MKKQIVLASIATLATTSAYATRARMNALGQAQDRGSFYINDTRNVFRNAARVNQTNNYALTEWGTSSSTNSVTAPNAEGGFFKNAGSFNYGVYLGNNITNLNADVNTDGFADAISAQTSGTLFGNTGFQKRSNDLDLFFGGDMGVEWGARLKYSNSKNEQGGTALETKHSALELGLGMVMGDLNAYVNYVINDEYENIGTAATGFTAENDGTMNLGVGYKWMDYTFFVDYDKKGLEYVGGTGVAANTTEDSTLTVGAGYTKEVSSTSRMFADISFKSRKLEDTDGTTAGNNLEVKRSTLPVTVGFETDATSWLTVRGSISQNVFINSQKETLGTNPERKGTIANTTNVSAGATLNFGKLMIDGMIGTNGVNGQNTNATNGVLDTDRILTQVAVHYWF